MTHFGVMTVIFVLSAATSVESANILLVSNCLSHSHSMWYNKMATLLVDSGHQVVLLDTDPLKSKAGNITHFYMEDAYDFQGMVFTPEVMEEFSEMATAPLQNLDIYYTYAMNCRKLLKSRGTQNLMNSYRGKKFDLIILDYYCESFLGLITYFGNPPFIIATAFADPESVYDMIGHYDNPSFVPARMFSSFTADMHFVERATNTFRYLYNFYKMKFHYMPYEEESVKQVFGPESPNVEDIRRNVSVVMVNTHFSISGAKPLPPSVIQISGFHIEPSKPLPKDIKEFLDGAKNGAILFSFGSNLPSEMISEKKVKMYLEVFSSIPQRVLWKFNESLIHDKIPANVMMRNWLPQQDILAHEKTVVFISHGGLLGTQEAMYFGVPIIGVPFGVDQLSNIEKIERRGQGVKLSFKHVTSHDIREAIFTITGNKSYMERMKDLSRILRDNPMSPRDKVTYWVEYVLRNKDHLSYIRSHSSNLKIYQLFLLDLLAATVLLLIAFFVTAVFIINIILRWTLCRPKKIEKQKEN